MTTKLKIDLSLGLLEVEGSEAFVKNIYADFKTHFAGIEVPEPTKPTRRTRKSKSTPAAPPKPAPAAPESPPAEKIVEDKEIIPPVIASGPDLSPLLPPPDKSKPAYTYIKDLALGATKDRPSLVEFMDSKFPITNEERNIVFLYYLQHLVKLKPITLDHIYTCYRAAKIRAPLDIEKSFDQRGWIKMAKNGNMSLNAVGKNYVEQQLPKRLKN